MRPSRWKTWVRNLVRPQLRSEPRFRPEFRPLEDRTAPAVFRWVSPTSGNWSTPGNWLNESNQPAAPPTDGTATLEFTRPSGTNPITAAMDFNDGARFAGIVFRAGDFTLGSSAGTQRIVLTSGGITSDFDVPAGAVVNNTVGLRVSFESAGQPVTAARPGNQLTLGGVNPVLTLTRRT